MLFPPRIHHRIQLEEQEVQHLTNGWKVIIWMPANWTIRLPQTTHRFVNTPETGNVAASCNETIKKKQRIRSYFNNQNNNIFAKNN